MGSSRRLRGTARPSRCAFVLEHIGDWGRLTDQLNVAGEPRAVGAGRGSGQASIVCLVAYSAFGETKWAIASPTSSGVPGSPLGLAFANGPASNNLFRSDGVSNRWKTATFFTSVWLVCSSYRDS